MRHSLAALLAVLAMAASPRAALAASRGLKFTEYAPVRPQLPRRASQQLLTPRRPAQQETAVGLVVGMGTTGAVGVATGNPLLAGAAGATAGTAAAFQTGIALRVFECLSAPGQCSLTSA